MRHAIDAGNGLQKVMLFDDVIQIHHLFDGRVEASNQHTLDNDNPDIPACYIVADFIERQFETLDNLLVNVIICEGFEDGFIVARARDDCFDFHPAEQFVIFGLSVGIDQGFNPLLERLI